MACRSSTWSLGGKALNYEPCLQIPMLVFDPRLPANRRGQRESALVQSIDVAPTLLELGGAPVPESVQGRSLVPLLRGDATDWREYSYAENLWSTYFGNPRCESVRGHRWKYIRYFKNDRSLYEGFDLRTVYRVNRVNTESYRRSLTSSLNGEQPDYEELFDLESDPHETKNLAASNDNRTVLESMRQRCLGLAKLAKGDVDAPPLTVPLPVGEAGK